jgi:hypothetical protein
VRIIKNPIIKSYLSIGDFVWLKGQKYKDIYKIIKMEYCIGTGKRFWRVFINDKNNNIIYKDGIKNFYLAKKQCVDCKKYKNLNNFYFANKRTGILTSTCKECNKKRATNFGRKHPEKRKNSYLKHKYGITLEQHKQMLKESNGLCEICGKEEIRKGIKGKVINLSIDHNHQSGKIRGLLCQNCNSSLGALKEDIKILENMINYLKKYNV